jgi:hypothetical protein
VFTISCHLPVKSLDRNQNRRRRQPAGKQQNSSPQTALIVMCCRPCLLKTGPDPKFEIGHVLFIDVVGYSKLLINEQSELLRELNEITRQRNSSA